MAKSASKSGRPGARNKSKAQPGRRTKRATGRAQVLVPPSLKEAMARVHAKPDFFASLTPEQRAAFEAYDGPEVSGGPGPVVRPKHTAK
jgi:hypothetical protein